MNPEPLVNVVVRVPEERVAPGSKPTPGGLTMTLGGNEAGKKKGVELAEKTAS